MILIPTGVSSAPLHDKTKVYTFTFDSHTFSLRTRHDSPSPEIKSLSVALRREASVAPKIFVFEFHFDNADDYCDASFYSKTILLPTFALICLILRCEFLAVKILGVAFRLTNTVASFHVIL